MKKFRLQYNSPVILTFALVSLVSLILGMVTGNLTTKLLFSVYRAPLTDPLTYVRLFTYVLGHGGFEHYISNMLLLLVVGPPMEEKYGSHDLLIAIAATAAIAGLVQMVFFPHSALLGASGIVFMLIVLSSLAGMQGDGIPLTLILVFALYVGKEAINAVTVQDNISQLTHIIGGLCGAGLGLVLEHNRKKA